MYNIWNERHRFIFDNVPSTRFGIMLSGQDTFVKPAPEYERISVPGRNGDLLIPNNRFENVSITYHCFIRENFRTNYGGLMSFLHKKTGYRRLEDSYHPEYFRLGAVLTSVTPTLTALNRHGEFDLTFDCKPQMFLKSGEKSTEILPNTGETFVFYNPTNHIAKPLIDFKDIYSSYTLNAFRFYVGQVSESADESDYEFCIQPGSTTVNYFTATIDSDSEEILDKNESYANYYILKDYKFPVFYPGENRVKFLVQTDSWHASAVITPRWWTI